jgi:D-threonate/D-erythronate kinase
MPRALIIADDLTGATDTAHAFAKRGYDTAVQVGLESSPSELTVLAVNTASRYIDPETARSRVVGAASETNADIVYNKVDSTLRGNIVPEINGVMSCGFDYGLFAPAAPTLGRTTAAGYHLVDGELLSATEYTADPNGPACSHLPTLIEDVDGPVSHLDIGTTAAGAGAVRQQITKDPPEPVAVCDGTHDRHLSAIANAGEMINQRVVHIGSAGLAEHIHIPDRPHTPSISIDIGNNGALGVIGSTSETALSQIQSIPDNWVIELEKSAMLSEPERTGAAAGKQAFSRITSNRPAVITAAVNGSSVKETLDAGEQLGLETKTVQARVTTALASAAEIALAGTPAGLFVTGGETAMSVFGRVNVTLLSLSGEEIEAGIPVSRLQDGSAAGTTVITKAGGFGMSSTAINCLRYLGATDE